MDQNEQPPNVYEHLHNYAKEIESDSPSPEAIMQALTAYFASNVPFIQTMHFAYAVDVKREQICFQYKFGEYLGYENDGVNLKLLNDILHHTEQKKLSILYHRLFEFIRQNPIKPMKYGIVIGHRMRKANGKYIKILRYVHPFLTDEHHKLLVYYCLCIDVSHHQFNTDVTFDVILTPDAPFTREQVLAFFSDIIGAKKPRFTARQLEVIKVWSETDSAKIAAERLDMKVRTLETHLKNLRKKLGVRRTMDVVLYALENRLI